ncbi:MAG: Imm52 family immunity protein, partial [Bacteroidota bacterium]
TRSISAIWKSKKKSVEECTELVLNFLLHLKDYDYNLFGVWYEKGNSKKKALEKKVELSIGYIQSALKKNWDKKFDDLGARISYWTGNEDEDKSSSISFNVGAYGDKSFNKNSCVINLPQEYKANEKDNSLLFQFSKLEGLIIGCIIRIFCF